LWATTVLLFQVKGQSTGFIRQNRTFFRVQNRLLKSGLEIPKGY
jgi:hypothetical protein